MLTARPLYDNAADAALFVEPPVWPAVRRALDRELNVLLTGERGSGKTTLLRQLQRVEREAGRRVVFVDAGTVDDAGELVGRVHGAVTGAAGAPGTAAAPARTLQTALLAIADAEPALVLVDASGSGRAVYDVFGRQRDALWQGGHRWVVAVDDDDVATVLRPPADAFFDVHLALAPFTAEQARRLLRLRTGDDVPAEALDRVATEVGGNPRQALRTLSSAAVRGASPEAELAARTRLVAAAGRLGRPHTMLMLELLERGQASASDAGLQRSLGVSRPRLSQLLSALEDEELVDVLPERREGPGRPRLVYRPRLGPSS